MTSDDLNHTIISPPADSLVDEVPCDLLALDLADGYPGRARLFETANPDQALVYLHGIQSHGGWFLRSCDFLKQQGMTVLAPDRRGSGLNSRDRGHCDCPAQLLEDVNSCVDWLGQRTGAKKIKLVAVSWSGKLALAYAHKYPEKLRSLVLVTPGLCPKIDIGLTDKIAIGAYGLVNPRHQHEIPLNDPSLFTRTPSMLTFIENDPLKLTYATASFFITSARLDKTVRKIAGVLKIPVYLQDERLSSFGADQATLKLLRPALKPIDGSPGPARIYQNALHTLDFEPDPHSFFEDLARCLRSG